MVVCAPLLLVGCHVSCTKPIMDPALRSPAIVVLPGAERLSYLRELSREARESANYELRTQPPAAAELELVRAALRSDGWREVNDAVLNQWVDVAQRKSEDRSEKTKCASWEWLKGNEVVSYHFCTSARDRGLMEIDILRLRADDPDRFR